LFTLSHPHKNQFLIDIQILNLPKIIEILLFSNKPSLNVKKDVAIYDLTFTINDLLSNNVPVTFSFFIKLTT